jgi:DNA repair protein RadD
MDAIVTGACEEIARLTATRKSVLLFASSLAHGRHVQTILAQLTEQEIGFVCGDTASGERADLLGRFKSGNLKYLVNCQVLTTGFDAPNIDAVVLLRATLSPGLYYQMVGRGFRIHPEKTDCIVLDYGENTVRHGPVDAIKITDKTNQGEGEAPAKECPHCRAVVFAGVARCPECGFEFPRDEHKHKDRAGKSGILSGEVTTSEFPVLDVRYYDHAKRNCPDAPHTMRVEYETSSFPPESKKEWLCFDHEGWPRQRAEQWWRDRSLIAVPRSVESAVQLANAGALAKTTRITWREVAGEPFGSIVGYEIADEKPTPADVDAALIERERIDDEFEVAPAKAPDWFDAFANDDIPF